MDIKPGQWIYTREWQGPFLLVKGVTAKRVTCVSITGSRALIEPHQVVAASDTREGAVAAELAFRTTRATYRGAELADIKDRRRALTEKQNALEREILAKAIEAAQAAASLQGVG